MTWVTLIAAALICAHLFSDQIGRRLDRVEVSAHSFGAGMAVAYVFLHLLPELEKGHRVLGHAIHIIALAGFVAFYAAENWIRRSSEDPRPAAFGLRVALHSIYNWLVISTLPEAVEEGIGYALLLSLTLALHILSSDYSLRGTFPREFALWGRWVLAGSVLAGWITDLSYEPMSPLATGTWIALLCGFVLCNVFRDEMSGQRRESFRWFAVGVGLYTGLSLLT